MLCRVYVNHSHISHNLYLSGNNSHATSRQVEHQSGQYTVLSLRCQQAKLSQSQVFCFFFSLHLILEQKIGPDLSGSFLLLISKTSSDRDVNITSALASRATNGSVSLTVRFLSVLIRCSSKVHLRDTRMPDALPDLNFKLHSNSHPTVPIAFQQAGLDPDSILSSTVAFKSGLHSCQPATLSDHHLGDYFECLLLHVMTV